MKTTKTMLIAGLLAALLVIGIVGATHAHAQTADTGPHPGRGHGFGLGQAELAAAAKALGMTIDELSVALKSGTTLEQLATQKGVDIQTVKDAITATRREEMRTRIQQAVSDGTMTQAKADWLLEGLDKGYFDGPGFGFGFGPHKNMPNQTPPMQPTQSSGG